MKLGKGIPWLAAGFVAIVVGYITLGSGSITWAPILLVAGYCVLVPLALLAAFRERRGE